MKIIDLLNKIANGEEVPKKIKYNGTIYEKFDYNNKYYDVEDNTREKDILSEHLASESFYNDEVEILEEEKKIPERVLNAEVFNVPKLNKMELSNIALKNKEDIKIIKDTLNKVLDYLKSKGE